MENKIVENNEGNEMFSSITDNSSDTGGSSKGGSLVVLVCCLLTFFFGGWLPLIIAAAVYTPFRKQSNGWLIFLVTWLFSNLFFFILVRSIF